MKVNSWPQVAALVAVLSFVLGALALGKTDVAAVGGVVGSVLNAMLPSLVSKSE